MLLRSSMGATTAYRLIAFDFTTGDKVIDWPNVTEPRPAAHQIIHDGEKRWDVIGVLPGSTPTQLVNRCQTRTRRILFQD
jgi:hypothetical protein